MKNVKVLVQMVVDNAAVWQAVEPIDAKFARRMSNEELKMLGVKATKLVEEMVRPPAKSGGLKIRRK